MIHIGIYSRKSVYRDNSISIETQEKKCKEYCSFLYHDQDLEFHMYNSDEGFSGKNTIRPSYQQLMVDVRNGLLNVVMVYKLDRISRSVKDFSNTFSVLQEHDVSFVSVTETFDTSTAIGRTIMYILASFAELERENISGRVADNMQSLGSDGFWTGGKLPCGMSSIRQEVAGKTHSYLVTDPEEIWRVELFGTLLLSGYSITAIERYCRDHNITSQTGKFLNTSQIYFILTNPVYCQNNKEAYYYFTELGCKMGKIETFDGLHGMVPYGRTCVKKNQDNQSKTEYKDWTITSGIHDYVFEFKDWLAIQNRMGQNKQVRTAKYKSGILKGVLQCHCGSKMGVRTYMKNDITFSYYYCQNAFRKGSEYCQIRYYRVKDIDELFVRKLKEIEVHPDDIVLRYTSQIEKLDIDKIKTDIKSTEADIHNLTSHLRENAASSAAKYIIEQIEDLDHKLSILNNQLRRAKSEESRADEETSRRESVYHDICYLMNNFDDLEYQEKNELIRKIVKKCVLKDNVLDIEF